MGKWIVGLTFAAVSMLGALAPAAPADIFVRRTPVDPRISALSSVDSGAIALFVTGFTDLTALPLPQIPISSFLQYSTELQIVSPFGQNLVLVGGGDTVFAMLTGPGLPCVSRADPAALRDRLCRRLLRLDPAQPKLD